VRTTESVSVPAPPDVVYPHVVDLAAYPTWLPLVHAADPDPGADAAWRVELRARVGPFARSKQLRMIRTVVETDRSVEFERAEVDGRHHARWALRAELAPVGDGTLVTMHLAYDGALWTGGILERVLEEEVRRGRVGLVELVRR
jgi:ribosome-associated toxin RatA of RatAB toxin-antitoxin module